MKRYGQVSKDGKVDIVDGASVGVYSATNGLSKLASSVTFGVVSFDGDKTAKELEDDVTNMVRNLSEFPDAYLPIAARCHLHRLFSV